MSARQTRNLVLADLPMTFMATDCKAGLAKVKSFLRDIINGLGHESALKTLSFIEKGGRCTRKW